MFYKSVIVSGCGGVIGHYLSNPFYLIKTHLQSESARAIAVGYQHHHDRGTWNTLFNLYNKGGVSTLCLFNMFIALHFGFKLYTRVDFLNKLECNDYAIILRFVLESAPSGFVLIFF